MEVRSEAKKIYLAQKVEENIKEQSLVKKTNKIK